MGGNRRVNLTKQRRAIVEELGKVRSHPTADEVYEMVRKRVPRISLGTVYRNLETLSDLGVVMKLATAGERKRFDGNASLHYHIRCRECGRVDDIDVEPLRELDQAAGAVSGYRNVAHSVEFVGTCSECAEQKNSGGRKE